MVYSRFVCVCVHVEVVSILRDAMSLSPMACFCVLPASNRMPFATSTPVRVALMLAGVRYVVTIQICESCA